MTVVCCARRRSITRAASGSTPRSGTQVSSGSVIKSSSMVQEWPNRPVVFSVGLQGVGIAERATQQAFAFAHELKQMGHVIADFPDV